MKTTHAVLPVLALLLVGCTSTDGDVVATSEPRAAQSSAPATDSETPSEETEPEQESDDGEPEVLCEDISPELLAKIQAGAQDGTGMVLTRGAAYRSPDFEKAWFVAAEFTATGIDPQVGVWVTNDLDPSGGIVMSADSFAKEFTVWPDASTTDAAISAADPSIAVAEECLG